MRLGVSKVVAPAVVKCITSRAHEVQCVPRQGFHCLYFCFKSFITVPGSKGARPVHSEFEWAHHKYCL